MTTKMPAPGQPIADLQVLLGDRVSTAAAVREQHGHDESHHPAHPPAAVAFPETTVEVSDIVRACARHGTPVVPFGAGTSLEGGVGSEPHGVSISTARLNRIVRIGVEDMDATVQAGVTRKQLNADLHDTGLFFPVDPGADASIGGMTATRASGTNAVRYGTMRENVLNLTVVLADGRIIATARRARKSAAGYDLTRLMVGSEGTLGVITEVTVRLAGVPEAISAAICAFPTVGDAVNCCIQTIQSGIPVVRMELLDEVQMDAVIRYSNLAYDAKPTLLFEFYGSEAGVREQAETVQAIADDQGGAGFQWALKSEDRSRLWQARHDAYYAALALRQGSVGWATDVCVPISRLAQCISETHADLSGSQLLAPIVGHVGDGNFHVTFVLDPDRPSEFAEATRLNGRLIERALAMDGTYTGEHGVGAGKIDNLVSEHGEGVQVMALVKQALDPGNIMNPGKILRV